MKYFVVGYYGHGNAGDNWCLNKALALIKAHDKQAICSVLWGTEPTSLDIIKVKKTSVTSIIKTVLGCDKVVFGGGGLLQNKTSSLSLIYYLTFLFIAKLLRKPSLLLGQGVGPIKGWGSNVLTKVGLNCISKASVRDAKSLVYFPNEKVKKAVDLTFWNATLHQPQIPIHTRIGLSFCSKQLARYEFKSIFDYINELSDTVLFSFFKSKDNEIYKDLGVEESDIVHINKQEIDEKMPPLTLMVAMRYHACIWSALNGIPFVAIAYDEKVEHIANELGQPVINCYNQSLNETALKETIKQVLKNQIQYKKSIKDNTTLCIKAATNHEWVMSHE